MATTIASVDVGGTGLSSLTSGYVPYGNGTGALRSGANLQTDGTNLGLGVTPSTWATGWVGLELQTNGTGISGNGNQVSMFENAYRTNAGWIYQTTGPIALFQLYNGNYYFQIAQSGTAGTTASFSTGMTLNSSGQLGIGTTPTATLTLAASGTGMVNSVWTSSTRPSSPANGQQGYNNTTGQLEIYNSSSTTWVNAGTSGNTYSITYLVVAGGGSGGNVQTNTVAGGGGGGAGGLLTSTATLNSGTVYTALVGAGGPAITALQFNMQGANGQNSSLTGSTISIVCVGGGGGGGSNNAGSYLGPGSNGGSGGGSTGIGSSSTVGGGSGTSGQGNNGGSADPGNGPGGGGGGSGSVGGTGGNGGGSGGNGGTGTTVSITGTAVTYAGGGGGSSGSGASGPGSGGAGGGGAGGGYTGGYGGYGAPNTGGGGGASAPTGGSTTYTTISGAGGSGIVILSIPTAKYTGTYTGNPTITTNGSNTIIKFTSSGTYTA